MRLTIPHYYDFGAERERVGRDLADPAAWDTLRDGEGPFGLPSTRSAWEAIASDPATVARAEDVIRIARGFEARRLCSYGVGTGALELQVARHAPELELTCTDYAPRAVARLRELFPEATVVRHDLLADEPVEADLHLLHRVDTEFSDPDLRGILLRFEEPVLLVPSAFLGGRLLLHQLLVRFGRRRATRAGWLRSEDAFRALWRGARDAAEVRIGETRGFLIARPGAAA